jgi:polar amino acid transport system substrate-binding protein
MTRSRVAALIGAVALLAAAIVAAGCGSDDNESTTGGTSTSAEKTATPGINETKDSKIAAEVPSAIAQKGTLTVAADATYAPNEFIAKDGHTVIGMDPDLMKALGQVMGLKTTVKNVTFDSILPGLAAKKYDVGASSFTVTKEREKTVDFVTYANVGTSFFVPADGGPDIGSLDDLCGHKVAAEKGTTQADDATAQNKKCKSAGDPGVTVQVYPDQNAVNLALTSGRADVGMGDSPVVSYAVDQSGGKLKLSGNQYAASAYGLASPKGSGLEKPMLDALKKVMDDGTYEKIFTYWGLDAAGGNGCPCTIDNPEINPTNVPAS